MTYRWHALLACAGVVLAATGASAATKPSMRTVLRASYAVRNLSAVDLRSDGRAVAWQESFHDPKRLLRSPLRKVIEVQRLPNGVAWRLTAGKRSAWYDEEDPVWSPRGKRIAFLSDARSAGQLQVFVANADGTAMRQIGKLAGDVQRLTWSPGGRRLAFLYIAHARRKAGALAPSARRVGVIGTVVDEQRLTTVNVASGLLRQITPAHDYVYEYDWSPRGRRFAVTYAHGSGDDNWWIAHLATVNATTGSMHDLLAPSYQMNDPRWAPGGKSVAIVGGLMSDFGSTGGDVYLVDASTGTTRDVTAGDRVSVQSLHWNDDATMDVVAHVLGSMHLMRLDVAAGKLTPLTDRQEALWSWSSTPHGRVVALVRTSFDAPPEVWAGPPKRLVQVSHSNAGARKLHGKGVSITWKSDPYTVQGWLVYPLGFDPKRAYPMVTIIHGGPSAESVPGFGSTFVNALASQGYFVFMPNPRGSFGQGEAFTRANVKDFGYGDWRDDLAGVDAAVKSAPIDAQRLGLAGWSYGGYMAMWAETQTTRFKAIVAGAGVANWQSYYGQNQIDQWMIPFFGASVYQDPAIYARSSPITFIERSKTPVLILQGELDEEVPAAQAFEFWHAMKTLGVPTKLVVYAGEGHAPRKIADQVDILDQMVHWFGHYLRS